MKIPPDSILQIPKDKLQNYLLDPKHPDGKAKADFFRANGIDLGNFQELDALLKSQVLSNDVTKTLNTPFGIKYIVEGSMRFPNGRSHNMRSVWIKVENEKILKFVTAYKI